MSRVVTLPPQGPLETDGSKLGGWWHEAESGAGRVVCDLCPRGCTIKPGERGFCFVRQNREGCVVSTTYGRSTGFCIDPIEKKPLHHFYPGSAVLSFGTPGCNLGCRFCQNWTMSRSRDVEAACEVADPATIARAAAELACRSVAFTYNDPIIWAEYAIDTARACHEAGVKTVAVTSGYIQPEARTAFFEHIDAANVDLKAFSEEFYRKQCAAHLDPVLDTLRWLVRNTDCWLELTTLLIPRENDSPDEIKRMCGWIAEELGPDVPLHFSAFFPAFQMMDHPPTPLETLLRAHEIAERAGLHYVFTGNVSDAAHQGTTCPGCRRTVIRRDGYTIESFEISDGRCRHCRTPIAGRFDDRPGDWGLRRMPVRIESFARETSSHEEPTKESPMTQEQPKTSQPAVEATTRPTLTPEQETQIFRATGRRLAAVAQHQTPDSIAAALGEAATMPVYGAFVSLKRAGQLRSCCGFLGEHLPLAEAVDQAAMRTAKDDPRFPPVSPSELGHLDMEVWLLWAPEPVEAKGEDRIAAVTIGTHGLQIARGSARGLLLPGVAVEHKLDARGFLEQVCLKAGLPRNAWKDDNTQLMRFEGYAIRGPLAPAAVDVPATVDGPGKQDVAGLAEFCRRNLIALFEGATPSYYLSDGYDGGVCGIGLRVELPNREPIELSQLALRPDLPLQSTLFSLTETAAGAARRQGLGRADVAAASVGLTLLFDPALHGMASAAQLDGFDASCRAVLLSDGSRWAWVFDPSQSADSLLAKALKRGGFAEASHARVVSFAAVSTLPSVAMAYSPDPQLGPEVRPAAVAGMFYPDDPKRLQQELDAMLPTGAKPEPWAAALVPHAGWAYSGRLAAEVLSRVRIPPEVIILCPRHRPGGALWAVAPHRAWAIPGGQVEGDPELAQLLAEKVSGLELDAAAHRQEHAIEVQLPILARLAPKTRVVGISIAAGELPGLLRFGQEMAEALTDRQPKPLLLVSTDMNHFADDAQTRKLDRQALDALKSLDPERLYQTVQENRISMCGMMGAVIAIEALRQWGCLSRCEEVGYATSAETTGDTSRVVGYAGLLLG